MAAAVHQHGGSHGWTPEVSQHLEAKQALSITTVSFVPVLSAPCGRLVHCTPQPPPLPTACPPGCGATVFGRAMWQCHGMIQTHAQERAAQLTLAWPDCPPLWPPAAFHGHSTTAAPQLLPCCALNAACGQKMTSRVGCSNIQHEGWAAMMWPRQCASATSSPLPGRRAASSQ